jgi:class 3 adenylate cyclase
LQLGRFSLISFGANYKRILSTDSEEHPTYSIVGIAFNYCALVVVSVLQRRKVIYFNQNEELLKQEFVAGAHLDSKALVAKDLLGLLLPKFVLDEMQQPYDLSKNLGLAREVGDVAILFCDIADFDMIVKKYEGNVVYLLDKIVRRFDELCILHGVQKIETVGKTYMAVGGLPQVEQSLPPDLKVLNFTLRTLNLAKDMMSHINEFEGLKLKIGIHVGRPVMGVIGCHKPQFSLIGDAINTASRHCATGKKGRIMLSESAVEHLEQFETATRGFKVETVYSEMKGKGNIKVIHLYPPKYLFNQKLKNILERADGVMDPEQLRQVNVLHKASIKKSATDVEQEMPAAGGYYSIVLHSFKKTSSITKALEDSKISPRHVTKSGPHTQKHVTKKTRGTNNQGAFNWRHEDYRDDLPERLQNNPNLTNKSEPLLIDSIVFDVAEEEKLEEEVSILFIRLKDFYRPNFLDSEAPSMI